MNKYIKDGKVAVLISPGFGAGWFTWTDPYNEDCLFDEDIVKLVLEKNSNEVRKDKMRKEQIVNNIEKLAKEKFGEDFYVGGAYQLEVEWVTEGNLFRITEYDGSESLIEQSDFYFIRA